jgi:hypothetical protein
MSENYLQKLPNDIVGIIERIMKPSQIYILEVSTKSSAFNLYISSDLNLVIDEMLKYLGSGNPCDSLNPDHPSKFHEWHNGIWKYKFSNDGLPFKAYRIKSYILDTGFQVNKVYTISNGILCEGAYVNTPVTWNPTLKFTRFDFDVLDQYDNIRNNNWLPYIDSAILDSFNYDRAEFAKDLLAEGHTVDLVDELDPRD